MKIIVVIIGTVADISSVSRAFLSLAESELRRDSFTIFFALMVTPVSPRLRITRVSLAPSLFSLV